LEVRLRGKARRRLQPAGGQFSLQPGLEFARPGPPISLSSSTRGSHARPPGPRSPRTWRVTSSSGSTPTARRPGPSESRRPPVPGTARRSRGTAAVPRSPPTPSTARCTCSATPTAPRPGAARWSPGRAPCQRRVHLLAGDRPLPQPRRRPDRRHRDRRRRAVRPLAAPASPAASFRSKVSKGAFSTNPKRRFPGLRFPSPEPGSIAVFLRGTPHSNVPGNLAVIGFRGPESRSRLRRSNGHSVER
jgi:hypothetical protein